MYTSHVTPSARNSRQGPDTHIQYLARVTRTAHAARPARRLAASIPVRAHRSLRRVPCTHPSDPHHMPASHAHGLQHMDTPERRAQDGARQDLTAPAPRIRGAVAPPPRQVLAPRTTPWENHRYQLARGPGAARRCPSLAARPHSAKLNALGEAKQDARDATGQRRGGQPGAASRGRPPTTRLAPRPRHACAYERFALPRRGSRGS